MKMNWMRISTDGDESRTLFFVFVSWLVLVVKYLLAGLTLPVVGTVPAMSATEFGSAVTLVLAIWLGREWKEAHYKEK